MAASRSAQTISSASDTRERRLRRAAEVRTARFSDWLLSARLEADVGDGLQRVVFLR